MPTFGNGIAYEQDVLAIGTDSVLLADFALPARARCDLGCGAGAVMLLMALKGGGSAVFDGVELRPDAVEKARRNVLHAGLTERMTVYHQDLRKVRETLPHGAYTAVVSNPPYLPLGGSIPPGTRTRESRVQRRAARFRTFARPLRTY